MKAAEWIDRLKAKREWESDYRAAKELGIARATVSKYRSNADSTMDDDTSVHVAQALGIEPELILLDQALERSKNEHARAALARALKRLGGAVAGVVLAAGLAAPSPAPAATDPAATDGLCIMSNRRRKRRNSLPLDGLAPLDLVAAFALAATSTRPASL